MEISKSFVILCLCLFIVPAIQAAYFTPCYYNVDYSVKIQRVSVYSDDSDLNTRQRGVLVSYKATSDVRIPKGRARVDTFLSSESMGNEPNDESHSFCEDTECPIVRGDRFQGEFRLNIPRNYYGPMSVLMRVVDQVSGRELTCTVINFESHHDRVVSETE